MYISKKKKSSLKVPAYPKKVNIHAAYYKSQI